MKVTVTLLALISFSVLAEDTIRCRSSGKVTVSSAEQAIVAAKAAWASVYEKAQWHEAFSPASVAASEPYSAVRTSGVWFVSGKSVAGKAAPVAHVCDGDGSVSVSSK